MNDHPNPHPDPDPDPRADRAGDLAAADRREVLIAWCWRIDALLDLPLPAVRRP
ncbi:hypothetical protein [Embleya sp. NPDC005971]|uniref:hypothetical protein n=1 Tax=Embleya sp. NPDC005971 TaxID=3156724 RepID=UPI0033F334FA